MRPLILIDSLLLGGAERLAVEGACHLDRERFEPHVIATRCTGPLEERLREEGVSYTLLERRRRLSLRAYRRARELARSADLIHSHKLGSNVWGAALARATRRPLVVHEHNWSGSGSWLRTLVQRTWIAPVAQRVVCVSAEVAATAAAEGFSEQQITVLAPGIRLGSAGTRSEARRELGLDEEAEVVGAVAALRPEKRHDLLVEAVAALRRDGRRLTLCVVGGGPCLAALRERARAVGIEDQVIWAGERANGPELVAAFDVAVICSDWEGVPLACLEALAAGVPVVGSAVGGLPRLLAGGAGRVFAPGDSGALAAAVADVLDARLAASDAGAQPAGRAGVRDVRAMAAELERIYAEAVEAAAAPAGGP